MSTNENQSRKLPARFTYKKVGNMSYEVSTNPNYPGTDTAVELGTVWRTRDGWSARNTLGTLVVDDSPISRATAAGCLSARSDSVPGDDES